MILDTAFTWARNTHIGEEAALTAKAIFQGVLDLEHARALITGLPNNAKSLAEAFGDPSIREIGRAWRTIRPAVLPFAFRAIP